MAALLSKSSRLFGSAEFETEDLGLAQEEEALALINACMRPEAELSMAADFPLLIGAGAKARRVVITEAGKIIAHAAARILHCEDQRPGQEPFLIANVGAVCVHPNFRGRGLASTMVQTLHREFEDSEIAAAVLWSDKAEVYARLGYQPFGAETQFQVQHDQLELQAGLVVRAHQDRDLHAMLSLRAKDPVFIRRSFAEAARLFRLPLSKTRVVLKDGQIVAYLCFGKGLDFAGTVCEWAGRPEYAAAALRQILSEGGQDSAVMIGPSWNRAYVEYFDGLACPRHDGPMALMSPVQSAIEKSPLALGAEGFYIWGLDSN